MKTVSVTYRHRFSIRLSLDDYRLTSLVTVDSNDIILKESEIRQQVNRIGREDHNAKEGDKYDFYTQDYMVSLLDLPKKKDISVDKTK